MAAVVVVRPCGTRFTPAEETFRICHTRLSGESVVGYHHERKLSGPTWPYVARRGPAWPCVALLLRLGRGEGCGSAWGPGDWFWNEADLVLGGGERWRGCGGGRLWWGTAAGSVRRPGEERL